MSVITPIAQELRIGEKVFTIEQVEYKIPAGIPLTTLHMHDEQGVTYTFHRLQAHDENNEFGDTDQFVASAQWKREVLQHNGKPVLFEIDDSDTVTVIS